MSFNRPEWPDGANAAVTLTFDNFGESFDLLRYGHAGGANADGVYAPRRGIGRILDLLERHRVPATFFVEGWNARKYASLAREIVERGHELAAHGWMHESWSELSDGQESDLIKRTTETLGEILGHAPRGWRSPGGLTTPRTLERLHAAGYRYDSSFGDDDVPYLIRVSHEPSAPEIVELPWSWALDDAVYYAHPGTIRPPSAVVQFWTEEFDAAVTLTGNFMLVCHPRYSGRPARAQALERLIEHMQSHDGIWFARCEEVADFARAWDKAPRYDAPETMAEAGR